MFPAASEETPLVEFMRPTRPYSDAIAVAEALAELRRCSGSHFHPRVVRAFCELIEQPGVGAKSEPGPQRSGISGAK